MLRKILITLAALLALATLALTCGLTIYQGFNRLVSGHYFRTSDFTRSSAAFRHGIDNTPTPEAKANLDGLVSNILDPVRQRYGSAIFITSGYRSPRVNALVGGTSTSQHVVGQAADICPPWPFNTRARLEEIFAACIEVGGYDQLILERRGFSTWIHVSWRPAAARGSILGYKNGTYVSLTRTNWRHFLD